MSKKNILLLSTVFILLNSCYYNNVEELYPQPPACDTSNVTFSNDVLPVLEANCFICHSGNAPIGNFILETYEDIVVVANSGALLGAINHEPNWSPMPKNGDKLDSCTITKIEIWVADSTPDN